MQYASTGQVGDGGRGSFPNPDGTPVLMSTGNPFMVKFFKHPEKLVDEVNATRRSLHGCAEE